MMLKINKTLPRNKVRYKGWSDTFRISRVGYLGLATLICGIMPGLMGLSYYVVPTQKVSAVEQTKTIDNIKYMQELSKEVCEATPIGISTTLIDLRDDSDYTIAKLSDGKCWMTQNLRIAGGTVMSRTDTDLYDSVYTTDIQTYTLPVASSTFSDTQSTDSTGNIDNATYMNNQVYNSTNSVYGAYYSWCAATAGTCQIGSYVDIQPDITKEGNPTKNPENTTVVARDANASSSICPKGWKLPTAAEQDVLMSKGTAIVGDFTENSMTSGYWIGSSVKNGNGGAFFPAAGSVYTEGTGSLGLFGRYWSSTANIAIQARLIYFTGDVAPYASSNRRYIGYSIRCISADIPEAELPKDNIPDYPPIVKDRGSAEVVAVVVPPVISIDAAEGDSIEVDPNVISSGTITATVSANTAYKVQLSASQTSLLNPNDPTSTGIPASSNLAIRTNGWGILNDPNDSTRTSDYSAITTTPTTYYNTTTTNEDLSTTHTFGIGVAVALTLPAATYSTSVTITAVNN